MLKYLKRVLGLEKKVDKITAEELFKDDEVIVCNSIDDCTNCCIEPYCKEPRKFDEDCNWVIPFPKEFVSANDSILLIDDNAGMVSFLIDDMEFLKSKGCIDNDINILPITTSSAAFSFNAIQEKHQGLNIKWALIDITLGGSRVKNGENEKLTGVDVYEMIIKYNPDVNFLFYTGNNLNPYIRANEKLIQQFKDVSGGKNIKDYVLFKTSMDMDSRRNYIQTHLFKK